MRPSSVLLSMLFACGLIVSSYSQSPQKPPVIVPPSPNASAFSKYGNVPVSTYTGVPNIDIPLYEINVRDIKIPISVSYHASGIKVSEEASRVGLGWVLNAGGLISRNIINKDDLIELPFAFLSSLNDADAIPQGPAYEPLDNVMGGVLYQYKDVATNTVYGIDLSDYIALPANVIDPFFQPHDFEPDQFNYNFLGHSGKFVMNKNRDVLLEKKEKIRIVATTPDADTWEVTTPDGFVYKFEVFESFVDHDNTTGYPQRTAWYLTKIISPQQEVVTFKYKEFPDRHIKTVGNFYEKRTGIVISCEDFPCSRPADYLYAPPGEAYSNIALDSIKWSNGAIKVNMSERDDLEGDLRISSIQVFKKDATASFQEITFHQDYFIGNRDQQGSPHTFMTEQPVRATKRLKLTGITKSSPSDSSVSPERYSFNYYEADPSDIPPKNSFAKDHWGYSNGRYNNSSLLPTYHSIAFASTVDERMGAMGDEREASEYDAKLLTLESIIYPTRGKTKFHYSLNDFDASQSSTQVEPKVREETTTLMYDFNQKGIVQYDTLDMRDEFITEEGNFITTKVKATFRLNGPCSNVTGSIDAYFELRTENNLLVTRIDPMLQRCSSPTDQGCIVCPEVSPGQPPVTAPVLTYTGTLNLAPGKYIWKAYVNSNDTQLVDVIGSFIWMVDLNKSAQHLTEPDGSKREYRTGAGLRVTKIEDYSDADEMLNVRKYDYHYKTDLNNDGTMETRSYGILRVNPAYSYYNMSWEKWTTPEGGLNGVLTCLPCYAVIRDSAHPFANYSGQPLGYSKVVEYHGENGEGGRIEYEYENYSDEVIQYRYGIDQVLIQPPSQSTKTNPKNGLLKKQAIFTAGGTKLQQTENFYETKYQDITYAVSHREIPIVGGLNILPGSNILTFVYQAINSEFQYLTASTHTNYMPNGTEALKTTIENFYDSPVHLQLTRQTTKASDKHYITTRYKYAADYGDSLASAAVLAMKGDKFMHAVPIEVSVFDVAPDNTTKLTSRTFTIFENINNMILQKEQVILENATGLSLPSQQPPDYVPVDGYNTSYYKKIFSLDYNSNGNVLSVQKTSDHSTAYVWGHENTLPIAEVKNALSAEVDFTSFEAKASGTWSISSTSRNTTDHVTGTQSYNMTNGSITRTSLSAAQTYIVSFWAKTGPVPSLNAGVPVAQIVKNGWTLYEKEFTGLTSLTIAGSGTIDELRLRPKGSMMTSYTYDPLVGITSSTDVNNRMSYFEYDGLGKLIAIRDDLGNLVKTFKYRFRSED